MEETTVAKKKAAKKVAKRASPKAAKKAVLNKEHAAEGEPLVFFRGRYGALADSG